MSNHIISSAMYNAAEKVLDLYAQQQELREKLGISQRPCPRCGGKMREGELVLNALSRYSNAYICPDCGVEEAYTGNIRFARATCRYSWQNVQAAFQLLGCRV